MDRANIAVIFNPKEKKDLDIRTEAQHQPIYKGNYYTALAINSHSPGNRWKHSFSLRFVLYL